MGAELHHLTEGWLELESDPGLFTLLIEDFGCRGVQVEEIYDLGRSGLIDGHVYGFIFLFKWSEDRRSRTRDRYNPTYSLGSAPGSDQVGSDRDQPGRSQQPVYVEDEDTVNDMFFATQIIPNSCATHALLSVLLNSSDVDLGPVLSRLRDLTRGMGPENKGHSIGNTPELAAAHNAHASVTDLPEPGSGTGGGQSTSRAGRGAVGPDSFHFVSYVPIRGRLYELDGLKRSPIDHGPIKDVEGGWTEQFRQLIEQRIQQEIMSTASLNGQGDHDIRYNLMAVVPDRRKELMSKIKTLKCNRHLLLEAIETMMRPTRLPGPFDCHSYSCYPPTLTYNSDPPPPNVHLPEIKEEMVVEASINSTEASTTVDSNSAESTKADSSSITSPTAANLTPTKSVTEPLTVDTTVGSTATTPTTTTQQQHKATSITPGSSALTTPLRIVTSTSVSPAPSTSSTDTSSEAGSAFNSPNTGRDSLSNLGPITAGCQQFYVMRMSRPAPPPAPGSLQAEPKIESEPATKQEASVSDPTSTEETKEHKAMTPRTQAKVDRIKGSMNGVQDLVKLLRALEDEISTCENSLKEELEKRKQYRVHDERRTHNYDEFIQTFILMLAEQGRLPELLERDLNGTSSKATDQVVADDLAAENPDRIFAELWQTMEELKDETPSRTRRAKDRAIGGGIAEFLTRVNKANHHEQNETASETTSPRTSATGSARPGVSRSTHKSRSTLSSARTSSAIKVIKSPEALAAARKRKKKRPSFKLKIGRR